MENSLKSLDVHVHVCGGWARHPLQHMYLYLVLVKHDIILRVSQHGDKLWGRWVAVSIGQGRKQALVWREGRTAVQGHGEVLLGAEIHWMVTLIHAMHVVYSLQALQTMQVAVTEGTAQHPASITQSWADRKSVV